MTPEELAVLTDEQLLTHLGTIAAELDGVNAAQSRLWAERIEVYLEGRRRGMTFGRLAEVARVSEVAISTKLQQLDERADVT